MAESSIWWLMTGAAVAIELVTGTFYLLMFAVGLAAAAVALSLPGIFYEAKKWSVKMPNLTAT
jgi:membrane protein implicated in regulation of membrane protease activity